MPIDAEIRKRLANSVAAVEAPSDVVEQARRGGYRRLRRNRAIAASVALVTCVATGSVVLGNDQLDRRTIEPAVPTNRAPADPYRWLMSGPPRGDLVRDKEYVREAKEGWQRSHADSVHKDRGIFDDLRGEPKVAWAGRTPAGKAAVVVQEAYLHPHSGLGPESVGLGTLVGFIGEGPGGRARLVEDLYPEGPPRHGVLLGPTLVVLDDGQPTGYATHRTYADNGSITRSWTRLNFRDGAAIVTLPPGTNLAAVRLSHLRTGEFLSIAAQPRGVDRIQLLWGGDDHGGGWPMTPGAVGHQDLRETLGNHLVGADPTMNRGQAAPWFAYGVTPNGSQVEVTEYAYDDDPPHVFAAMVTPDGKKTRIVHGGVATRGATLPVMFRLPDGQGWVIVNYGAELQLRRPDGSWDGVWEHALLVPDTPGIDQVQVTQGGTSQTVNLG